jgi:tetratricopeptide (TPR) repeat protein
LAAIARRLIRTCTLLAVAAAAAAEAQTMNMQVVAQALGVRCEYCHSAAPGSDAIEPKKEIARAMMAMTRDLNVKIQEATGKTASETARVECVTCHRGAAIPQPLPAIILRTVAEKGGAAAADQYRQLRKEYYGRATYDFSEDALLEIVQRLVEAKPDDAIALLRMNLEFNPQSAKSFALIGFAYTRKVDDVSAIMNLEKSLELDPANGMVRGMLEQLQEDRRRKQKQ